tara:strand:+ start:3678 stop:4196 length:519 start_codon:yes stop_codon:yes gene_type:complete
MTSPRIASKSEFYKSTILNSMCIEEYIPEERAEKFSTPQKLQFIYKTFHKEVGEWSIPRVGTIESLEYWLSGLPSILNIPFQNYDILKNYIKFSGKEFENEDQEDEFLNSYFRGLANALFDLKNERIFKLTLDNEIIFTGSENECFYHLQKIQPNSYDHATKYEGYKVNSND